MTYKKIIKLANENKYEFVHIKETSSTMKDVKNFLNINNKNCIILSDTQTAGKGQRGNFWHSPKGNVYCSISFDNFLKLNEQFLYSVLISVTIKETLDNFNAKNIKFKWPNDILHNKKKFSGMIFETYNYKNIHSYIVSGFGINIFSSPKINEYEITHANAFCKIDDINKFLLVLFNKLFINLNELINNKKKRLINVYRKSLLFKNSNIDIVFPNKSIKSGKFININPDGSLMLEINGKTENIYNGSIKI